MHSAKDKVSVIIVTCNSGRVLTDCLRALVVAVEGIEHQLIVIDNASRDHSAALASELFPSAVVVRNQQNVGFAGACNQGSKIADGEYLLFLNPDTVIDRGAVRALRQAISDRPNAGLVSGRLRFADGTFQPTCRNLPTATNLLFSRGSFLTKAGLGSAGKGRERYTLGDFNRVTEVPAVAGAILMIRAKVFADLGRFDERYFMYMEDTDLCRRAAAGGYANLFVPTAGAIHKWGQGSLTGAVRRSWYHHRSVLKYFHKHNPGFFSYVLLPWLLLANLLAVICLPRRRKGNS